MKKAKSAVRLSFFIASVFLLALVSGVQSFGQSDRELNEVIEKDKSSRDTTGNLMTLPSDEHLRRADIYMAHRLFPQAREHWQKFIASYPQNPGLARAYFGMGRSLMWERDYSGAIIWFDRAIKDFPDTKEGREALAFKGASYVRLGCNLDAVKAYQQYIIMYPNGERIESAYLNIIDALREAGKYSDAELWVKDTVEKFSNSPASVNALHAQLRMEIYRQNWTAAITAADQLLDKNRFSGSMTSRDEVIYLRFYALKSAGRQQEADQQLSLMSPPLTNYFANIAQIEAGRPLIKSTSYLANRTNDYPVVYKDLILKAAAAKGIDPRFLLSIMKQESSFRPAAKSPAGARGLLQLVFDTAIKYKDAAGYSGLAPDDLYNPNVNIALGVEYIDFLLKEFGGLYEGVAASYNAGEDNALRWLKRSKPQKPGIFVSEIGFAETKNYVQKVMLNYRIYCELYNERLERK
ncbi:MAG TPA: transglycosylase SLT domain-containing protein [Pyrinomonadaceae bacterium]|nr:transglycosylase SLT domain-containing protein [Pyrinomonadaceae bacterium]